MNRADPDLVGEIANLGLRFVSGPLEQSTEAQWREGLRKAVRFHQMAERAAIDARDRRKGPGYESVGDLIRGNQLGRSSDESTVWEKRIRPRFPRRAELQKAREHFSPEASDSMGRLVEKACSAVEYAGIRIERYPATVLLLLGWGDCFEDIKRSGTLHWSASSSNILYERWIVEPTNPPGISDLMPWILDAAEEMTYQLDPDDRVPKSED